jgi:hypothetical protein
MTSGKNAYISLCNLRYATISRSLIIVEDLQTFFMYFLRTVDTLGSNKDILYIDSRPPFIFQKNLKIENDA